MLMLMKKRRLKYLYMMEKIQNHIQNSSTQKDKEYIERMHNRSNKECLFRLKKEFRRCILSLIKYDA